MNMQFNTTYKIFIEHISIVFLTFQSRKHLNDKFWGKTVTIKSKFRVFWVLGY